MQDCIFCKIIAGQIPSKKVFEDEDVFVFNDIQPLTKGHCLVIPKNHCENIFDINSDVLQKIIIVTQNISLQLKKELGCLGVNIINNSGKTAEQVVGHFHLHIIPRYENDGLNITQWWQSKVS